MAEDLRHSPICKTDFFKIGFVKGMVPPISVFDYMKI